MFLFRLISNIFKIENLRNRLFYTLFVLFIFRFGKQIPLPEISFEAILDFQKNFSGEGLLSYLNMISGGALSNCAIFTLGVMPYISASIIMQILSLSIPYLENLSKEGESGRAVINQYTRYLTLVMAIMQSVGAVVAFEKMHGGALVLTPGWMFRIKTVLALAVGAMFVMWLGEQISKHGLGSGSSMLIFAGIVGNLPVGVSRLVNNIFSGETLMIVGALILVLGILFTTCIVFLERGERRIPIQYARKMVGRRMVGNPSSYLPFKLNPVGVMPIILASNPVYMLTAGIKYLFTKVMPVDFLASFFDYNAIGYYILMSVLIVWFNFAYTSLTFNPLEVADNLRKSGGFIPGIRPGYKTAEFLDYLLTRLGTIGSVYMALLAVLPNVMFSIISSPVFISGTSILIAVGVAMEVSSQVESFLIERRYETTL